MTETEAQTELRRVLVAYPSYRQWVRENTQNEEAANETFDAWWRMWLELDHVDVSLIVGEIVSGAREPHDRYSKPDAMPRTVARAARERRDKRMAYIRQREEFHAPAERPGNDAASRFGRAKNEAMALGKACRLGQITQGENDSRMLVVRDWLRNGGAEPEWITGRA